MTKGLYTPRSGARSFLDALTSEAAPDDVLTEYRKAYPPEPTRNLPLTLEESGWLCHLLCKALLDRGTVVSPPVERRMLALYGRLGAVNDTLMGKGEAPSLAADPLGMNAVVRGDKG
jgi:hypothetical protein